jgi:hypothetical protein
MASFSLKEIYNPNSIFAPNGNIYDSSVIPLCFQILRFLKSPPYHQNISLLLRKA